VQQTGSVASLGATGVFTKEIQAEVLAGRADLAVHSLKDLPTAPSPGLRLIATPEREVCTDALVAPHAGSLESLPAGSRIGTGSLRRRAQLLALRPDLSLEGIRGNVDTRLRKLDEGQYDAIVLAAAGLIRLGWAKRIAELLAPPRMLPAPGQGALGIECREDDESTVRIAGNLDHLPTRLAVAAERALLRQLDGGCSAPIAAWGRLDGDGLALDALVADLEGRAVLRASRTLQSLPARASEAAAAAIDLGEVVARDLLSQGARSLISAARNLPPAS
jgi:hydroxymethylbilane synthase